MVPVPDDLPTTKVTQPMAADAAATVITAPTETPQLSGYRCERLLGRGGMGEVWLAQHLALQRNVALKVMRPELAKDRDFAERFLREARAAAKLTHPGVVNVYDAGQADGHLYLAMEYVSGGDLGQFLSSKRASIDQALDLIIRAAEGLQAIHDAGLVHRDLKPDNILIDAQGHPRIADLGLARTQVGDDRMTATGMAMGTPAYMSPEQAQGSPDLDGRSDVYSLAATLFAVLAGRPPFSGPTPYVTVARVLNDPAPNLHTLNPKVPIAVATVIAQALSKQPGMRPASARAFATALEQARHGRTSSSASPQRRHWWLIGGAIAAIVLLGVVIGVSSPPPTSIEPVTPASTPTPTPSSAPTPAPPTMAKAAPPPTPSTDTKTPEATTPTPPVEKKNQPFRAFRDSWRELRGALRTSLPSRLPAVHNATVASLKKHHLDITKNNGGSTSSHLEATLDDGTNLTIALSSGANDSTDVVIQVGKFGDTTRSQTVLQWIKDEL